jgi:hypothetical protein
VAYDLTEQTAIYLLEATPSTEPSAAMFSLISITTHTTSSSPRPHILYNVQLSKDGKETAISRRYSEVLVFYRPVIMLTQNCISSL